MTMHSAITPPVGYRGLPYISYPPPAVLPEPTDWAFAWRLRWFREVGSVHHANARDGSLVACYSDARDPAARLALQAEIEATPDGPALVLAACIVVMQRFDAWVAGGCRGDQPRGAKGEQSL